MAQSVSNDALWEKLSEISEQLNHSKQTENVPDLSGVKDEIVTEIKGDIRILGLSSDSHFKANRENIQMLDENIRKILGIASRIRKQQREAAESQKMDGVYFSLLFFKIRKSSLIIAVLGLLVFSLTLFCMKQQNDYVLLMEEGYRQSIEIREKQVEGDSLRNANAQKVEKKKKDYLF